MPASARTRLEALERRAGATDPMDALTDDELRSWIAILKLGREGRTLEADAMWQALPAATQARLSAALAYAAASVADG